MCEARYDGQQSVKTVFLVADEDDTGPPTAAIVAYGVNKPQSLANP
jgi:hypothetical protein